MRSLFPRRDDPPPPEDDSSRLDDLREQRLDDIKALAERFTYDLGLLMAGHDVNFEEYVNPPVAARLRASMEPFLATGDAMRPNFGEYGDLRVEGDLAGGRDPVMAYVEFEDQSIRETAGGDLIPVPRHRMNLTLTIDPTCRGILDALLAPVDRSGSRR
jgi:hypothetical protein